MSTTASGPDLCTPEEFEAGFREYIVPRLLTGYSQQEQPVAVFVAGQPGAGKTKAEQNLRTQLGIGDDAVTIDADDMRDAHPRYKEEHGPRDDLTAAAVVHPDASRWTDRAVDHVIDNRHNAVFSTTFSSADSAEKKIAKFREAGYRVEVAFVAVDNDRSDMGVAGRYQGQHDREPTEEVPRPFGRYVPPEVCREAYTGVLDSADRIDQKVLADRVHVFDRDGTELYDNTRQGDQWERPAGTRAVIEQERARPWTPAEAEQFRSTYEQHAHRATGQVRDQFEDLRARGERRGVTMPPAESSPRQPAATERTSAAIKGIKGFNKGAQQGQRPPAAATRPEAQAAAPKQRSTQQTRDTDNHAR